MKKIIPLILLLILVSCGARSKYKYFEEQAILDQFNPILQEALKVGEERRNDALNTKNRYGNMQPFTYNGDAVNFNLYSNDPAFEILGFSPYRNNAELYRDYYKNRKDSWTTLWGLFN